MRNMKARLRGDARRRRRHGRHAAAARRPVEALARWGTEEALADPTKFQQAIVHVVLPGYFETMRTRVIEGRVLYGGRQRARPRAFSSSTGSSRAKAFPGQSRRRQDHPRQRSTRQSRSATRSSVSSITSGTSSLARDGREAYLRWPMATSVTASPSRWAVRTSGDPMALAPAARRW